MADGVKVTIRKKDALLQKLAKLSPAFVEAVTVANRQSAEDMVNLAKNYVPVKSGRLRDSIVVTGPGEKPPAYAQGAGSGPVPPGSVAVSAGNAKVRYAALVEYGTKPHVNEGQFVGTKNPGARRQPFFWPAYRVARKRMRSRAVRAINKVAKSIASSGSVP